MAERETGPAAPVVATLEGVVQRIVYENPETGFFVARLQVPGRAEVVTFIGNLMAVSPGETIRLQGRWVEDTKWGRQLRVEQYETVLPTTVTGIEAYLSSGLIEGIGPVYAKRLVEAFGLETLRVIDEAPQRLRKVAGIGPKRANQIREAWQEQRAIQSIMLFLQGHGISTSQAVRIYKRYGDASVAVLRENPYRLAGEVSGIGFRGADKIAMNLGVPKDAPERAEAALQYVLDEAAGEGHVYLEEGELLGRTAALLEVPGEMLENPLIGLITHALVVRDESRLYSVNLHTAETACAKLLKRLLASPRGEVTIDAARAVAWVERTQQIQFSEEQREAVRRAAESKVLVITGGPGTGKTTVLRSLLAIFEAKRLRVCLAAPTGRAAKRMEEASGHLAQTLHRLLEFSPKQGGFTRDENNPLSEDVIIIDEASMIDVPLMYSLLKAVPVKARLFLVGDVDQLPSVGPGSVLMDIIQSNTVPVVWLKTVFRQAAESGIVSNAHRINRGEYPHFNPDDFFFVERKEPAHALATIVELVTDRIPKKFGFDPFRDIQVLSPMHRGEAGVSKLNESLQDALNASGVPVPRGMLRVGDKVLQTRNNYELDVYNGDVGILTLLDEANKEVQVTYEDRSVLYSFEDLDDLALAYAVTVHKSQGSEYPCVVLALLNQHYMMLQRNMIYTAITRGRRLVIVVGHPSAVSKAVHSTPTARRNTRLAERLRNF
jgi:exodeoxyribonuclease V alpha subunit